MNGRLDHPITVLYIGQNCEIFKNSLRCSDGVLPHQLHAKMNDRSVDIYRKRSERRKTPTHQPLRKCDAQEAI